MSASETDKLKLITSHFSDFTIKVQCKSLSKLLSDDKFSDVTFIVGENKTEIKANRALLSAHSPVFEAMLYGHMRESKLNSEIEIDDIDPIAFESVIKYCYCGHPEIKHENDISPIKQIADKYQINGLSELCDKYFRNVINENNFISLLNQSVSYRLNDFIEICSWAMSCSSVGKKADKIVKSIDIVDLYPDSMELFLACDDLNVKEEDLWEALVRWVEYHSCNEVNDDEDCKEIIDVSLETDIVNGRKRKLRNADNSAKKRRKLINGNHKEFNYELLRKFCPLIRFALMDGKYFVKNVKPMNVLTDREIMNILIYYQDNDANCYVFNTTKRGETWSNTEDDDLCEKITLNLQFPPPKQHKILKIKMRMNQRFDTIMPILKLKFNKSVIVFSFKGNVIRNDMTPQHLVDLYGYAVDDLITTSYS